MLIFSQSTEKLFKQSFFILKNINTHEGIPHHNFYCTQVSLPGIKRELCKELHQIQLSLKSHIAYIKCRLHNSENVFFLTFIYDLTNVSAMQH